MQNPNYSVPPDHFKLSGPGEKGKNFRFLCKICSKTISANAKSRINLRNHLEAKHTGHLSSFDQWCKQNDKRKRVSNHHTMSYRLGLL